MNIPLVHLIQVKMDLSLDKDIILSLSVPDEEIDLEARKAMNLCTVFISKTIYYLHTII